MLPLGNLYADYLDEDDLAEATYRQGIEAQVTSTATTTWPFSWIGAATRIPPRCTTGSEPTQATRSLCAA